MRLRFNIDTKNQWMTPMIHLLNKDLIAQVIMHLMHRNSGPKIQFIQQKIANQKSFHTIKEIMLGTMSSTTTPLKNHGKHQLQVVCHSLELMLSMLKLQFTQQRIANQRFFHIINVITLGMMNSTTIPRKNHGKHQLLVVCHSLELMLLLQRLQFIQPKIANLKFFHITNVTTLGMWNNIRIPLKNHGKHLLQMVCHWPVLLLSTKSQSTQLKIANQRFFHTTREIMPGMMNSTITHPRKHGKLQLQMECHWRELTLSLNPSKKRANFNLCLFKRLLIAIELRPTLRSSHTLFVIMPGTLIIMTRLTSTDIVKMLQRDTRRP